MKKFIGLDVHCKEIFYSVRDEQGNVIMTSKVPTSYKGIEEMIEKTGADSESLFALESGTQCFWVSRVLSSLNMHSEIINAHEVRAKATRIGKKTDYQDALDISEGIQKGYYVSKVYVPDKKTLRLRELISRRRHFVKVCTMEINSARFVLRSVGINISDKRLNTGSKWEEVIGSVADKEIKEILNMHYRIWKDAKRIVEELEDKIEEALEPFKEEVEILTSVPGVGKITAATFIGVVGDPRRFENSDKLVSYIGLAPRVSESGEVKRRGHITKRGSSNLRWNLCEIAQLSGRIYSPFHPYFAKICATKGRNKAIVAVAQRIARILYRMWKNKEKFDISKLNIIREEKLIAKKVIYQLKKEKSKMERTTTR